MLPLSDLGQRIMVLGPSNAGKSTLAVALSQKLSLPVVHLDQLQHSPNTDWEPRAEKDFAALHDAAIEDDQWVMDGNYSRLMPQRFERATGIILITSNHWLRLARYLRRTLFHPSARVGNLEGGRDSLKWHMVDWIIFKTPKNAARYRRMVEQTDLPRVVCPSIKSLKQLYSDWDLPTP